MVETGSENGSEVWKKFVRKHWNMLALFVVAIILASVGAVYVFLWFVGDAQSTGMVPSDFGSMDNGKFSDFYFEFDFLGSSLHRSPSNFCSGSRLAMVEEATQ